MNNTGPRPPSTADQGFQDVAAFLDALDPARREVVEALRGTIMGGQPRLREQLKWNSPTYTAGEVDLATINVQNRKQQVQLVLHRGASRPENRKSPPLLTDDEGLVRWLSDIRGDIVLPDRDSAVRNEVALGRIIRRWIELPSRPDVSDVTRETC